MEETKCYCGHTTYCDCGPEEPNPFELPKALSDDVFYESLEPKQETLEEAAERLCPINIVSDGYDTNFLCRVGLYLGVKWQEERSYSEEEVGEILYKAFGEYGKHYSIMLDGAFIDRLFKQFKKK